RRRWGRNDGAGQPARAVWSVVFGRATMHVAGVSGGRGWLALPSIYATPALFPALNLLLGHRHCYPALNLAWPPTLVLSHLASQVEVMMIHFRRSEVPILTARPPSGRFGPSAELPSASRCSCRGERTIGQLRHDVQRRLAAGVAQQVVEHRAHLRPHG